MLYRGRRDLSTSPIAPARFLPGRKQLFCLLRVGAVGRRLEISLEILGRFFALADGEKHMGSKHHGSAVAGVDLQGLVGRLFGAGMIARVESRMAKQKPARGAGMGS